MAPAVLEPGRSEAEHRSQGRGPVLPETTPRMDIADSHSGAQRPTPGHQPQHGLGEPLSLRRGLALLTPPDSGGPVPVRASLASCDGHPPGSGLSPPGRSRSPTDVLSSRLSSGISAFQPLTADQRPQATGRTSATHLCKFQHRPRGTFPTAFPPSRRTPKARGGFIGATAARTFSRGPVLEADSRHKSESRLRTREVTPRKPGRGIWN